VKGWSVGDFNSVGTDCSWMIDAFWIFKKFTYSMDTWEHIKTSCYSSKKKPKV